MVVKRGCGCGGRRGAGGGKGGLAAANLTQAALGGAKGPGCCGHFCSSNLLSPSETMGGVDRVSGCSAEQCVCMLMPVCARVSNSCVLFGRLGSISWRMLACAVVFSKPAGRSRLQMSCMHGQNEGVRTCSASSGRDSSSKSHTCFNYV